MRCTPHRHHMQVLAEWLTCASAVALERCERVRVAGDTDPDYPVLNIHVAERLARLVACRLALQVMVLACLQPRTVSSWSE